MGAQAYNSNSVLGNSFLNSKFLNPDYLFHQLTLFIDRIFDFSVNLSPEIVSIYRTILFLLSMFFIFLICYTTVRIFEIRKKEKRHLKHEIEEYAHHQAEREKKLQHNEEIFKNPRWIKTLGYVFSQHTSDWKLAIIEADSMLEELLGQLGFMGESLGDKLKSATQDRFFSLPHAWEVHTIRNRIAHEGASYELSQKEAKRVIAIYEQIFHEFGFI